MTTATMPQIELAISPFPTAGEPRWDGTCLEWVLTDEDGINYYGNTPDECYRQFSEALHYLARAARSTGFTVAELREFRAQERDRAAQYIDERPY